MKKKIALLTILLSLFLIACSGSDSYRGKWKATDAKGDKVDILFDENSFSVTRSGGEKSKYEYTQNSVNYDNGVQIYGIKLGDGRGYQIVFPNSEDETIGLIMDENGKQMFIISRKEYLKYEDVYKL